MLFGDKGLHKNTLGWLYLGLSGSMGLEIMAHRSKHTDRCIKKCFSLGVAVTHTEIRLNLLRPARQPL